MEKLFKILAACLTSALLLGISQPLHMPGLFFNIAPWQNYLGLCAFIAYVPLFLILENKNLKETFVISFLSVSFGLSIVLYWIYIAVHIFGGVAPLPAALVTYTLPALLALKNACFLTLAQFLSQYFRRTILLFAPLAVCAAEYFRNYYIFNGFPWGNVGYSLGRIEEFRQLASLFGVYGLVFFALLINALVAWAIVSAEKRARALSIACSLIVFVFAFGYLRLQGSTNEFAPSIRVALLQGNISQDIKSQGGIYGNEIMEIYKNLNDEARALDPDLIVWPESAYPGLIDANIKRFSIDNKKTVATILGTASYFHEKGKGYSSFQNSAFLIDYQGAVLSRYDKSHLVPFGEYVPWPFAGIVGQIVPGMGAFRPGLAYNVQNLPLADSKNIRLGTTICYEGIFPEISRSYAKSGAELLVNITNDAWYGVSSAPYQHLLMYQLRATESGLPFVRATNTGVSAFIDAFGRLSHTSKLFERDIIFGDVKLVHRATLYVVLGDIIPLACLIFLLAAFCYVVIPFRYIIKTRHYALATIIVITILVALIGQYYFSLPQFLTDESARTKALLINILASLVVVGASSNTSRSRAILFLSATITCLASLLFSYFESELFLWGLLPAILLYLLSLRIHKALNNNEKK